MNINKKKKYKINYLRLLFTLLIFILLILGVVAIISLIVNKANSDDDESAPQSIVYREYSFSQTESAQDVSAPITADLADITDETMPFGTDIYSEYGVLVDLENNCAVAERNADQKMYPASLTKIMTLIVAVENIENLDATFTMTNEIIAPLSELHASVAGFSEGEVCTLRDLLYGMILPSGADASLALATYVAGSESAFVDMMNQKCAELGLENTHFVNTSGLHDDSHYSTALDFAVILKYAMDNETCRNVLSQFQYTTQITPQHPEGILLTSDLFARMYGDEADGFTIIGGKTGFTDQAGHCLATFAKNNETGKEYLLILCKASGSKWYPVYDTELVYEYLNAESVTADTVQTDSVATSADND